MLSKENQLKVAGLSAVLATTLGLGGALVAPATALADNPVNKYMPNPEITNAAGEGNLTIDKVEEGKNDNKKDDHEASTAKVVEVVRLFNPWNGDHLFTWDEKEVFAAEKAGWTNEGTVWKAYGHEGDYRKFVNQDAKVGTPVYRLFNQYSGEHLYTTSTEEYNKNVAAGWTGEGVSFYTVKATDGKPAQNETSDKIINKSKVDSVYRMFNPFAKVGTHLYGGIEENAKCLADGWKADNVVDGKQQPMFEVFDLDHTTDEAKIAQSLARITKEYKANLEKYKALQKELLDATVSGKYDEEAEKKNIEAVQEVTKALKSEMTDVQFYLNKLQAKAQEIKDNLKGKHGAFGSDAFALASEVVFQKENYKTQQQKVTTAEATLADKQAKLASAKLAQTVAQLDLDNHKATDLAAAQKKLDELNKKLAKETEVAKQTPIQQQIDALKSAAGDLGKANKKLAELQKALDDKTKALKTPQDEFDKATKDLKLAKDDLANFKLLFKESVKKFNDFRHTLSLSDAQATRDLAAYEKYSVTFADLNEAVTRLSNKESNLVDFVVTKHGNVKAYKDAVTAANRAVENEPSKVADYSKVKDAVKEALAPYFMELTPEVDDMAF